MIIQKTGMPQQYSTPVSKSCYLLKLILLCMAFEEVLCLLHNHTTQSEDCDHVWNRHQSVEGVGQIPGQTKVHGAADEDHQYEHYLVDNGGFRTE